VLEALQTEVREERKGLWTDPRPVLPRSGENGNSVSGQAYFLTLAHLGSGFVALSGIRILGLNKSGSGCPPPNRT